MLNKIRVAGKVLPIKLKEKSETKELLVYFSLLVTNPNGVQTVLRCHASREVATAIEKEVQEEELIEVKGYLQNEKEGRQIIIKVLEFGKLERVDDTIPANQVRLLGKIVTDFSFRQNNDKVEAVSFKLLVPQWKNERSLYFCRAQGELIPEITNQLKKDDIILLEGFLQAKKVAEEVGMERKIVRISSIICQTFVLLDPHFLHYLPDFCFAGIKKESINNLYPWEKLVPVSRETKKIDFARPKR